MDVLAQKQITSKSFFYHHFGTRFGWHGFRGRPKDHPSSCNFSPPARQQGSPNLQTYNTSFRTSRRRSQSPRRPRTMTWPKPLLLLLLLLQTRTLLQKVSHCCLLVSSMVLTVNSWNPFYAQFMLANTKILESLFTLNPREAEEYLAYLKFLAIKETRFQTKAILAFDQDYRLTKAQDNYSWGSNLDDLSAQNFDALLHSTLLKPLILISQGSARVNRGHPGKSFVFVGTSTQMVAPTHSLAVTSTSAFIVPPTRTRARAVQVPLAPRPAKNERFWNWNKLARGLLICYFPAWGLPAPFPRLGEGTRFWPR